MTYLQIDADRLLERIPTESLPEGDSRLLFLGYAVLLRSKGAGTTCEDVHDVWVWWLHLHEGLRESAVPYDDLPEEAKVRAQVFQDAIVAVATEDSAPAAGISQALFPRGFDGNGNQADQVMQLYKMMVDSSENLVRRRQAVNTFFITITGAILTACGLVVKSVGSVQPVEFALFVLFLVGALLCLAWRSLITSFGQLNKGKFKVILELEKYLAASVYSAEWEALERGENPKVYRSFTSREIWVPDALLGLNILAAVLALLFGFGIVSLPKGEDATSGSSPTRISSEGIPLDSTPSEPAPSG